MLAATVPLLASLNIGIVVFNIMPGFPLDGGRVLRSLLWTLTGSYLWSMGCATLVGRGLGAGFIVIAVFLTVRNGHVGNLWFALLGWYLVALAGQASRHALAHERLRAYTARDLRTRLPTIPGTLTVEELWVERSGRHYLVELRGEIAGLIGAQAFTRLPRATWAVTPLVAVMRPVGGLAPVDVSAPAARARAYGREAGEPPARRGGGKAVGVVTRESILVLASTGGPKSLRRRAYVCRVHYNVPRRPEQHICIGPGRATRTCR